MRGHGGSVSTSDLESTPATAARSGTSTSMVCCDDVGDFAGGDGHRAQASLTQNQVDCDLERYGNTTELSSPSDPMTIVREHFIAKFEPKAVFPLFDNRDGGVCGDAAAQVLRKGHHPHGFGERADR